MSTFNSDLGLMYISEQTTPDDAKISLVNVVNTDTVFYVEFDACLQSFDVINRNSRAYLGSNIAEQLRTEKIQSLLADQGWYGEMDHPAPNVKGEELTPERVQRIELSRRSHKIMNPRVEGNLLMAHIQTDAGNNCGIGMGKSIVQGLSPKFSCRAIAAMEMRNGKPYVIVRKLITYDWVLYPSHRETGMQGPKQTISRAVTESGGDITSIVFVDQCIALKELMSYIGQNDPSTSMICESFGLDETDIIGITKDAKHGIVRDGTNMIYTNVDPTIVQRAQRDLADLF